MIAMRLEESNGNKLILLILEPGNLAKLKRGEPIHKDLNEFVPELNPKTELLLAYTPDIEWVADQLTEGSLDVDNMSDVLSRSLKRKVIIRDSKLSESMHKSVDMDEQ